jgi:hypothetical protein
MVGQELNHQGGSWIGDTELCMRDSSAAFLTKINDRCLLYSVCATPSCDSLEVGSWNLTLSYAPLTYTTLPPPGYDRPK